VTGPVSPRRLVAAAGPVAALIAALIAGPAAARAPRVVALDQCADQYVIALVPRDRIAGVTPRADDEDAWLRAGARGLPVRRPTAESILAVRPDIAVRYWGGDQRLLAALRRRGVRIVQIDEATDFPALRATVRKVARGVGQAAAGERMVARMDADLARSRGAWRGAGALYMTPSGFTAGAGTLTDAVLRAAGLKNLAPSPGFNLVSLERLVMSPPSLFVKAFYESLRSDRRGRGRGGVAARLARGRTAAELPGALLSCPAWFATEASRRLAERAPR
jgi:iron complex transport system substrate-binding protein